MPVSTHSLQWKRSGSMEAMWRTEQQQGVACRSARTPCGRSVAEDEERVSIQGGESNSSRAEACSRSMLSQGMHAQQQACMHASAAAPPPVGQHLLNRALNVGHAAAVWREGTGSSGVAGGSPIDVCLAPQKTSALPGHAGHLLPLSCQLWLEDDRMQASLDHNRASSCVNGAPAAVGEDAHVGAAPQA